MKKIVFFGGSKRMGNGNGDIGVHKTSCIQKMNQFFQKKRILDH